MYELFLENLLREIAPFLMLPVALSVLSLVLKIVKGTVSECHVRDLEEEPTKRDQEQEKEKINIDKDLQKYFNYKE